MELALSLGASMTATAATAGTAAAAAGVTASAAGTAAVAGTAGSALLGLAQGTVTAFSMLSTIGQGMAAKQQARAEAALAESRAAGEKVAGLDEANLIRRRIAEAIGSQQVALAAAGVRANTGTAAFLAADSMRAGERDLTRAYANSEIRRMGFLNQATALRARGRSYMAQAIIRSLAGGGNFLLDRVERG